MKKILPFLDATNYSLPCREKNPAKIIVGKKKQSSGQTLVTFCRLNFHSAVYKDSEMVSKKCNVFIYYPMYLKNT